MGSVSHRDVPSVILITTAVNSACISYLFQNINPAVYMIQAARKSMSLTDEFFRFNNAFCHSTFGRNDHLCHSDGKSIPRYDA